MVSHMTKTTIDPRPVTSFDDLIAITDADRENFRREYQDTPSKLRAVMVYMPLLLALGIVTVVLCAAYFVYRYLDELAYLLLFMVQIIFGG